MPSNVARHEFRQQLPFCNHENRTFLGIFGVLRQLRLDNPEAVLPKDHTWTSSKLTWVRLADGLPSYRESRQEGENSRPS